jgi:hypothetical protein
MRADMAKVICERPRHGGDGGKSIPKKGTKKRVHKELETGNERGSEGMKLNYGWDTKHFGEHLNPLRGYIRSCIGRKWDDVYSEVCSHINKDSVVQSHILTHLLQFIELNAYVENGIAYHSKPIRHEVSSYTVAIVDENGTVIANPNATRQNKNRTTKKAQNYYKVGDKFYLKDEEGIFYECTLTEIPKKRIPEYGWSFNGEKPHRMTTIHWYVEIRAKVYDYFLRKIINESGTTYRNPGLYCTKKRQLNSREIKKLKAHHVGL